MMKTGSTVGQYPCRKPRPSQQARVIQGSRSYQSGSRSLERSKMVIMSSESDSASLTGDETSYQNKTPHVGFLNASDEGKLKQVIDLITHKENISIYFALFCFC